VVNRHDDPAPLFECTKDNCSLRAAIIAANKEPGKNIITFARDDTDDPFTLSISGTDEDEAAEGDLDIRSDVIILGNGADKTIINGGGIDRVLHVQTTSASPQTKQTNVVIQGVTIRGGHALTGGRILNDKSKLTLNISVVRDNLATTVGGGIVNQDRAIAEINNSTNSTISGNISNISGGIHNSKNVSGDAFTTVTHSTITLNTSTNFLTGGAGIRNTEGTVSIKNSIVAGNKAGRLEEGLADCENEKATYNSLGYNLVGQNGDPNGCPTVYTDITLPRTIGTAINTTLQGVVPYHALVGGSPAIDAIPLGHENCLPPLTIKTTGGSIKPPQKKANLGQRTPNGYPPGRRLGSYRR
jgi:hypothetical protein